MEGSLQSFEHSFEELGRQVRELQARVAELERGAARPEVGAEVIAPTAATDETAGGSGPQIGDATQLVVLVGVSFLGIAAAYLLRALTEMGALPLRMGIGLAILYSLGWLVFASKARDGDRMAVAFRSLTSVMILAPVLWEAELRFHTIPSWATAGTLVAFAAFGFAVSWTKERGAVAWTTSLTGLVTASVMLWATRDALPFTWALIAIAALGEVSACLNRWLLERWAIAAAANLAVLVLPDIISGQLPDGAGFGPVGRLLLIQGAFLAIYASSTVVRTLGRGYRITPFEVLQCIAACAIAMTGVIRIAPVRVDAILGIGAFALLAATGAYWASFGPLSRRPSQIADFYVYSTFALLMAGLGVSLLLGATLGTAAFSCLALAALALSAVCDRTVLQSHGIVLLALAATRSGVLLNAMGQFLGTGIHGNAGAPGAAVWIVAVAAVAGGLQVLRGSRPCGTTGTRRAARAFAGLLVLWIVVGAAGAAVVSLCPHAGGGAEIRDFCPTILTALLIASSLGVLAMALRWRRSELLWIVYAMVMLATCKLVVQDMRLAPTLAMVVSLLLYGGTLVVLPGISRRVSASAVEP